MARLIQPKQGQSVVDYPWSSVAGGNDAGLPEVAAGGVAWRGAGGTLVGGGAQLKRRAGVEGVGSPEAGSGGVALEKNDGFAGMAGGKAIDAKRGEREPDVAKVGGKAMGK